MAQKQPNLRGVSCLALLVGLGASAAAHAQSDSSRDATASKPSNAIEEIVVSADRKNSFGASLVQIGGFRAGRVIDTPMTVSVVTKDLLEAQQVQNIAEATRNTAGVGQSQINNIIYSNLTIRGIAANNLTNYRLNGVLPVMNFVDMPMEDKERIEVLKGAAGLYYGFATPSGIVNLVTLRPTNEPRYAAEINGDSHGSLGGHVDVSESVGDDFGIRFNGGASKVETGIDKTDGSRHFAALSADWKPTSNLTFLFDAEYIYKKVTEPTEIALPAPVNGVIPLFPLLDPKVNLGAKWFYADSTEYNLLGQVKYNISPNWQVSLSVGQSDAVVDRRYSSFSGYNVATGAGTVGVAITRGTHYRGEVYRGDVTGTFATGPIEHEILVGVSQIDRASYIPAATRYSFAQNFYNPVDIPVQPTPSFVLSSRSIVSDFGAYIFDRMSYQKWLQVTVGYRKERYSNETLTSTYKTSPNTISYGAMVKPWENLSLYANYVEGLEEGGIAQQIAVNAGEVLPAALSKQKEVGVKFELDKRLLLTAAYFDINRAQSYLNSSNVFVLDGRASYRGVEFSASGEITDRISVSTSALFLQAKTESGAAAIVGKQIENTPRVSGSLFVSYKVPQLEGLALSAGAFYAGKRAVNASNNAFVPGYTTFSLGASYATEIAGHPTTFRLNADNLTDKRYWAATGSSLLAEGQPRTVRFSVSTTF